MGSKLRLYSNSELLEIKESLKMYCEHFNSDKFDKVFLRYNNILNAVRREIKRRGV